MSKVKFGNLFSYVGADINVPKQYAASGNLVFAQIKDGGNTTGYYIWANDTEATLVPQGVFEALKTRVTTVEGKLTGIDTNVVDYVASQLESYKVKDVQVGGTSVVNEAGVAVLGAAAGKDVATEVAKDNQGLVTSDAVQTAINAALTGENVHIEGYNVKDIAVQGVITTKNKDGIVDLGGAALSNVATEIVDGSTDLATAGQVFDAVKTAQEAAIAAKSIVVGSTGIAVAATTGASGETTYTVSVDDTIATKEYVDGEISKLGDVMSFIGVVSELPEDNNVIIGDTTATAEKGDVIAITNGEEYVWDGTAWREIGHVNVEEAVTSLGNTRGDIELNGDGLVGLSVEDQTLKATAVTGAIEEGSTGLAVAGDVYSAIADAKKAENISYGESGNVNAALDELYTQLETLPTYGVTSADGSVVVGATSTEDGDTTFDLQVLVDNIAYGNTGTKSTNVKGALDDLFDSYTGLATTVSDIQDQLNDLTAGEVKYTKTGSTESTTVDAALNDLYELVGNIEVPVTGVTGDDASYSSVETSEDGQVTVKNTLAEDVNLTDVTDVTAAAATGLATDAYVQDYVESRLAWVVLTPQA